MNLKNYLLKFLIHLILMSCGLPVSVNGQNKYTSFTPGEIWEDNQGVHINAHGGGIVYHKGVYYWFGEHKGQRSNAALVGVTCYSSTDLYNWKNEGVALTVSDDEESPIV